MTFIAIMTLRLTSPFPTKKQDNFTVQCIFGKFNAFVTNDTTAVDASKKNAALNTIVRSNAVNSCIVAHGLNRTSKNPIIKYFNTAFSVSK